MALIRRRDALAPPGVAIEVEPFDGDDIVILRRRVACLDPVPHQGEEVVRHRIEREEHRLRQAGQRLEPVPALVLPLAPGQVEDGIRHRLQVVEPARQYAEVGVRHPDFVHVAGVADDVQCSADAVQVGLSNRRLVDNPVEIFLRNRSQSGITGIRQPRPLVDSLARGRGSLGHREPPRNRMSGSPAHSAPAGGRWLPPSASAPRTGSPPRYRFPR